MITIYVPFVSHVFVILPVCIFLADPSRKTPLETSRLMKNRLNYAYVRARSDHNENQKVYELKRNGTSEKLRVLGPEHKCFDKATATFRPLRVEEKKQHAGVHSRFIRISMIIIYEPLFVYC